MLIDQDQRRSTAVTLPQHGFRHATAQGTKAPSVTILRHRASALTVPPQREIASYAWMGPAQGSVGFWTPTRPEASLRRSPSVEIIAISASEGDDRGSSRFHDALRWSIAETGVEDGVPHAAEEIIREALQSMGPDRASSALSALVTTEESPAFVAAVLHCIGRQRPGSDDWRAGIVRSALSMEDVEVRDAAAQAAENWGGLAVKEALDQHVESEDWLRTYIDKVRTYLAARD